MPHPRCQSIDARIGQPVGLAVNQHTCCLTPPGPFFQDATYLVTRSVEMAGSPSGNTGQTELPRWKLREAKTRFSKIVRLAATGQPQRVMVHGRDAVVIVGADEFDRLRTSTKTSLHELLSRSPLNRLDFGGESVRSPVREVGL